MDVMHAGRGVDTFDAQEGFANDGVDGGPGADDLPRSWFVSRRLVSWWDVLGRRDLHG
jgi:hypothetical protein